MLAAGVWWVSPSPVQAEDLNDAGLGDIRMSRVEGGPWSMCLEDIEQATGLIDPLDMEEIQRFWKHARGQMAYSEDGDEDE